MQARVTCSILQTVQNKIPFHGILCSKTTKGRIILYTAILFCEALFFAFALSLDAFVAAFSYGACKIKIPLASVLVMDAICSLSIGAALLAGTFLKGFIPRQATTAICFVLLFLLGMTKLLDGITKSLIQKHGAISSNIKFSFCNFRFVLSLYANPECADTDHSKTISPREAVSLAIALSLDGLAAGLGAALGNIDGLAVFLCSFFTEGIAVICGFALGNRAAGRLSFPISWLGGIILILLAFLKLF